MRWTMDEVMTRKEHARRGQSEEIRWRSLWTLLRSMRHTVMYVRTIRLLLSLSLQSLPATDQRCAALRRFELCIGCTIAPLYSLLNRMHFPKRSFQHSPVDLLQEVRV